MEQTPSLTGDSVVQMPRTTVQMSADHALILDTIGQPLITFHRAFVDVTGSVTCALWLSWAINQVNIQAAQLRRNDVAQLEDVQVWFECNHHDCERDTGLTRREQDTARRILRDAKILHERTAHRGKGFHIDTRVLNALLAEKSAESWSGFANLVTPQGSASASLAAAEIRITGKQPKIKALHNRGAA